MSNGENHEDKSDGSGDTVEANPWIISPAIDYLFVAGGAAWLLILANYLLIGTELPYKVDDPKHLILLTFFYVSQHVFFDAHNVATYFRLWGSDEDRATFRFYRTWLLYLAIAIFLFGVLMHTLIGVLVFLYLIVVFWHYAMQSFGVAMIYCIKRNYKLNVFEREVFRSLMLVLSTYTVARFFVLTRDYAPYNFYGAATPVLIPLTDPTSQLALQICTIALCALAAVFGFIVLKNLFVQKKLLPVPVLFLVATMAALGCTSKPFNLILWMYIPALFHASQYLAVSLSYYLKERGLFEGTDPRLLVHEFGKWPAVQYLGKSILIGCTLYVGLPHTVSLLNLAGYEETVGLVLVVINFHHFAADAALWRLRDQRIRKLLID